MNVSNNRLPGGVTTPTVWLTMTVLVIALMLTACGGGASTTSNAPPQAAQCIPGDPSTAGECGTLLLGLTDADGDFLSYTVNVLSVKLEKADGAIVEVMPQSTRIDFRQYVDMTEFISAATVPPGTYVAGSITLDYTGSEVYVEAGDAAKEATVVDADGIPLTQTELKIVLSNRDRLFVNRATTSLLTLDFDLDASHTVDIVPTPAIAVAEPFIIAEVSPVDTKQVRVRGRYIDSSIEEMYYTVALRPFHDRNGDFGRVKVYVTDETDFEVNEVEYVGAEGLRALEAAGQGTLTVAQGTLNVAARKFTANIVLAGSSVPGDKSDAVKGSVISRNGNDFVVRGGTVILTDNSPAFFRDDVTVTVGPDTKVYKVYRSDRPMGIPDRLLDISAISVGSKVTVRGTVTANDALGVHIDATQGAVLLRVTKLTGTIKSILPGQVNLDLHSINGRRASIFDTTCTGGCEPSTDADLDNYEVSTGNLISSLQLANDANGRPASAWGFPTAFGAAPPDFEGRTFIDYSDVYSALGVGWGADGSTAPFLMMDSNGLLLDNKNPDIDQRHYIKQGPVLIDLTTLNSDTLIAPRETGRKLFVIKTTDSLQLYSDWDDFVNSLTMELNAMGKARSMFARGHYDADTNVFTAYKVFVYILEP